METEATLQDASSSVSEQFKDLNIQFTEVRTPPSSLLPVRFSNLNLHQTEYLPCLHPLNFLHVPVLNASMPDVVSRSLSCLLLLLLSPIYHPNSLESSSSIQMAP